MTSAFEGPQNKKSHLGLRFFLFGYELSETMLKYKKKTAKALARGDNILTLNAISSLNGKSDAILPSKRNNGLPGGCGTPNV